MIRFRFAPGMSWLRGGLLALTFSACGSPTAPPTFDAEFALPEELQIVQGGTPTTLWLIADTLRFFSNGSGEKRGTLESRFSTPTRQSTEATFTYERDGARVAVTWLLPCSPACDAQLITTFYELRGPDLHGEVGSQAVLYRRVAAANAP